MAPLFRQGTSSSDESDEWNSAAKTENIITGYFETLVYLCVWVFVCCVSYLGSVQCSWHLSSLNVSDGCRCTHWLLQLLHTPHTGPGTLEKGNEAKKLQYLKKTEVCSKTWYNDYIQSTLYTLYPVCVDIFKKCVVAAGLHVPPMTVNDSQKSAWTSFWGCFWSGNSWYCSLGL